jgi:hypothetical protein
MYDCNIFCLGPGCEFWLACEKCQTLNTTSPQSSDKN